MTQPDLTALLKQGQEAVTAANDALTDVRNQNARLLSEKKASVKKAAEVEKMGSEIVDKLIETGFLTKTKKAAALEGIKDPVKVAAQLKTVLDKIQTAPIGAPSQDLAGSGDDQNPAKAADDRYLQQTGVA